jgi:hypothetical protein
MCLFEMSGCHTFNRKYDELRNLALQYANHHPASEANIGAAIGSMRQFPQNIGVQAIELLDQFHDLLWRKYDRP